MPLFVQPNRSLPFRRPARFFARRAFSLLEVLVSAAILITGIVAIAAFFPVSLRENQRSMDISSAAFLAQMKAEELRRDDNAAGDLIAAIRGLNAESAPVPFAQDTRFTYSFSGVTLLDTGDPADPRNAPGVARLVVRYAPEFRSGAEILYELRFDFATP
jgi:type II secretory pathway pseudopilin PulG